MANHAYFTLDSSTPLISLVNVVGSITSIFAPNSVFFPSAIGANVSTITNLVSASSLGFEPFFTALALIWYLPSDKSNSTVVPFSTGTFLVTVVIPSTSTVIIALYVSVWTCTVTNSSSPASVLLYHSISLFSSTTVIIGFFTVAFLPLPPGLSISTFCSNKFKSSTVSALVTFFFKRIVWSG